MESWRKIVIVLVGFFEALVFSGCLFGWASLVHVLQQEGVYSHLCTNYQGTEQGIVEFQNQNTTISRPFFYESATEILIEELNLDDGTNEITIFPRCKEQDKTFSLVYTVAGVTYGFTSILIGFALDKLGLWFTRLTASLIMTSGFLLLSFASHEQPWFLWPSLVLIAFGTNQLRLSCFQFGNLYPSKRSTIMILYSSAYSISAVLFLIIQFFYYVGISYNQIILVISGISVLTLPATFIMPRVKIEDEEETLDEEICAPSMDPMLSKSQLNDVKANTLRRRSSTISEEVVFGASLDGKLKSLDLELQEIPLGKSLWTISSIFHSFWQCVHLFVIFWFSLSFNAWAYKTTNDPDDVAYYNEIGGLAQLIGPLFIPIAGFLTDLLVNRAMKEPNEIKQRAKIMQAGSWICFLANLVTIGLSVCKLFFTKEAIYIGLVLASVSRPLVVGSCAAYIRIRFYPEHFNRLNGIYMTISSILAFVQYPLFVWMVSSDEAFVQVHGLLALLLVISLLSPIHMMFSYCTNKFAQSYHKNIQIYQNRL